MKVSVVIATFNEGPDLLVTVAMALASIQPPHEVIVVDDASDAPVVFNDLPSVRVIRNAIQLGPGRAKAIGANAATGDVIVLLDSHMRMPYYWLEAFKSAISEDPNAIYCCGCKGFENSGFHGAGAGFKNLRDYEPIWAAKREGTYIVPCLMGACYAIPKKVWDRLRGINPCFFGWGSEEFDLSFRAWINGFSVKCVSELTVAHRFDRNPRGFLLNSWHPEYNKMVALYCNLEEPEQIIDAMRSIVDPAAVANFDRNIGAIQAWRRRVQGFRYYGDSRVAEAQQMFEPKEIPQGAKIVPKEREQAKLTPQIGRMHRETIIETCRSFGPNHRMLEWGAGGSTLIFRNRGINLTTIEHNLRIASVIEKCFLRNARPDGFANEGEEKENDRLVLQSFYSNFEDEQKFDVILVDGVFRNACLLACHRLLKPNGFVFLHDSQRDWYEIGRVGFNWFDLGECSDYPGASMAMGRLKNAESLQ